MVEPIKTRSKVATSGDKCPVDSSTKSSTRDDEHSKPMLYLIIASIAMMLMPLGTYFIIQKFIIRSTTFAAMGAICMTQIVMAAYIYIAWWGENKQYLSDGKSSKKRR